jgi:hypothetical protein
MEKDTEQDKLAYVLLVEHKKRKEDEEKIKSEREQFQKEEAKVLVCLAWVTFSILGTNINYYRNYYN